MGGYGGALGKMKSKCFYDTGGRKVIDKNAIAVAEYYISEGKYVAFLQEKPLQYRADLSVDGQHTEIKGLTSLSPNTIEAKIAHAFKQIHGDDYKYSESNRKEGKVILFSRHNNSISNQAVYDAFYRAYKIADQKGIITGKIEFWIRGKIHKIN